MMCFKREACWGFIAFSCTVKGVGGWGVGVGGGSRRAEGLVNNRRGDGYPASQWP